MGKFDALKQRALHATDLFKKQMEVIRDKHKKGELLPRDIEQAAHAIYRRDPHNVAENNRSIFELLRFAILVGGATAVHPALGLVAWGTDRIIEEKVNEKYEGSTLRQYQEELKKVEEKLKKTNLSEDEKKGLQQARTQLKEDILKLENYFEELKRYKSKDAPAPVKKETKDDDGFGDEDWGFNESSSAKGVLPMGMALNESQQDELLIEQYAEAMLLLEFDPMRGALDSVRRVRHADKRVSDHIDSTFDKVVDDHEKASKDERIAEILHGRSKVSSLIKKAIVIGAAWAVNPAIAAIGTFVHFARKEQLKQEEKMRMVVELEKELEIVEEKIKDAEQENNKEKKYQLIRLRREIERSMDRLKYGVKV